MIVDTHCHASGRWYEPLDTLLFNMDRCGVDRAVLVQLLGAEANDDMIMAQRRHPDRFSFVAMIDPAAHNWAQAIATAHEAGAIGLRLRANWRSPGEDGLAFWKLVERLGLGVSMVGTAESFCDGALEEVATACPGLAIVLEHLAGVGRPDIGDRDMWLPGLLGLSRWPNIAIKLPGLGQLAPRLPSIDTACPPLEMGGVRELVGTFIAHFGAARMMWGSDFPPVAAREGYANALAWTRELVDANWPADAPDMFGGTACRFWKLT
jgi:L-fuconolactonase